MMRWMIQLKISNGFYRFFENFQLKYFDIDKLKKHVIWGHLI